MIDHNIVYESHPLYNQFTKWGGLDGTDDSYYMINTSLYAAESYILNRLGVNLRTKVYTEKLPLGSTETKFKHFPSKLLSIFKSNKLILPEISYFSTSEGEYITKSGDYTLDNDNAIFSSVMSNISVKYTSGYVIKDTVDYDDTVGSATVDTIAPSTPIVRNIDNTRLVSPTLTSSLTYDVVVKGEANAKVIINEVDSGNIVQANGEVTITLQVDKDTNVYRISLMDAADNVSDVFKVFIVKAANGNNTPELTVIGQELATKNNSIKCIVYMDRAGDIEVNGIVLGSYQQGVNELTIPHTSNTGAIVHSIIKLVVGTNKSKSSIVSFLYDNTLEDLYLEELNSNLLNIPYMPSELMVAFFRLAQHLYHGTLYKDDNIGRYSAGDAKSVTFASHRIPKDILNILHSYITY